MMVRRMVALLFLVALPVLPAGLALAMEKKTPETHQHGMEAPKEAAGQTMKEVMQGIQSNLERIIYGLSVENMALVVDGAQGIASHPMPRGGPKPYLRRNVDKIPELLPKIDAMVHDSAHKIADAAEARDLNAVAEHLSTMIRGCVMCHQNFR